MNTLPPEKAAVETTVDHDGVRIRVRRIGTGRPVVLVHGLMASGEVWFRQERPLAQDHDVIIPDLRGHGRSGKPTDGHTVEDHAADLDAVLEALNVERADVVGWSMGAVVAMHYAATRPAKVGRLALLSATPMMVTQEDFEHAVPFDGLRPMLRGLITDFPGTARGFAELLTAPEDDASVVDLLYSLALETTGITAAAAILGVGCGDLRGAIARIDRPTLVLHGELDQIVPSAAGRWVSEQIPGSRFEVFAGASHAFLLTRPDEVTARLREFLSQ
ncbi:MAG TPA: alpha/beta hydrolase [Amycolatopsis sp.]|nr:alpha/beta hydrolase [Amycolatopsis sp.]